jgi:nitrogen fixation protein FixH
MGTGGLILGIGIGVLAELVLYFILRRVGRMNAKPAAVIVALVVLLVYIPWAMLYWPGADVFAIHLALYLIVTYMLGIIGHRRAESKGGWHWAPAVLIAFFSFVVGIDMVFLGVAERGISGIFAELLPAPDDGKVVDSRFPGTVTHDYQQKEAQYNAYLEQVDAQHKRGWQVRKGWQAKPVRGEPAEFLVSVRDAQGQPVSGARVSGTFRRSSNSAYDFDFHMAETKPGDYQVTTTMPLPGLWQLVLEIRRGEDLHEVRAVTNVMDAAKAGS